MFSSHQLSPCKTAKRSSGVVLHSVHVGIRLGSDPTCLQRGKGDRGLPLPVYINDLDRAEGLDEIETPA